MLSIEESPLILLDIPSPERHSNCLDVFRDCPRVKKKVFKCLGCVVGQSKSVHSLKLE